jgi:transcriptional regulator with XRE-family HTH domain
MVQKQKKLAKFIALRIKNLRISKNLTQEDVYFETGIHIGRVEAGDYNIQIDTIYKICKYFDITLKDFFSEGFEEL